MQNSSPIQRLRAIHEQHPLLYAHVSFVIALVLLVLSAFFYQPRYMDNFTGFYIFLLSLPFIRLSFALLPEIMPHADTDRIQGGDVIRWHWLGLAILCMIALTMINMPSHWVQAWQKTLGLMNTSPHIQMILLCVGLLTVILGFGGSLRPDRIDWKGHHSILLGIVLLGGAIRLWNLEYTIHMFVDELLFMNGVVKLQLDSPPILLPTSNAFTDVFSYMQLLLKSLFGANLSVLRIPSAIWGIVAIIGIYALARQFFTVRVALISAFLLAIMPAHIHFSRIGINNITGATIGIWFFVYVIRGTHYKGLGDWAIAGVLLGLTHYFYEGDRIFFTLFLLLWIMWITMFCRHDPTFRLPKPKQLAVFVFCMGLVITPFYHTLFSHNRSFTPRLDVTSSSDSVFTQGSPLSLLSVHLTEFLLDNQIGQLGAPIHRYVQTPIEDSFYQSDNSYILPLLAPFFLLGFGILLGRIRTLHGAMLLWWTVGVAIGNSLIPDVFSGSSPRFVLVFAVLMLITAVGFDALWSILTNWILSSWQRWLGIGFFVVLGCLGLYQVDYYFNTIVPNFYDSVYKAMNINNRPRPAYDDMILRAVSLPENTTLHVFTDALFSNSYKADVPLFYGRSVDDLSIEHSFVSDLTPAYFETLPRNRNHVFTFAEYHTSILEMIEPYFVITQIEGSPYNIPDDVEMTFYYASTSAPTFDILEP